MNQLLKTFKPRIMGLTLSVALILGMVGTASAANDRTISDEALLTAAAPAIEAFAEHYNILSTNIVDVTESVQNDGNLSVEYFVEIRAVLNYENATELPQIQGLAEALSIDSETLTTEEFTTVLRSPDVLSSLTEMVAPQAEKAAEKMSDEEVSALAAITSPDVTLKSEDTNKEDLVAEAIAQDVANEAIGFVEGIQDEYIGETSSFNLGLRAEFDPDGNLVDVDYALLDGYAEDMDVVVPNSVDKMKALGAVQADDLVTAATNAVVDAAKLFDGGISPQANDSFVYYRQNAATYANYWTSNAPERWCSVHGQNIRQDTSKYNSNYAWYCCNDCANYVSQAMRTGSVPTDSTWAAGKSAWINCASMEKYFTETKNWWSASNFTSCNAGGIIMLNNSSGSPYHVVMNVQNDTVVRAYSGHTNDRLKLTYSSDASFGASSVSYYRFANVYPAH
ncbi:MAG TPA: amidase domain-containing protein [Anaerovoracaceae bacterium]|nr:amidase domain-containing protein [Anaerovoracaceae bacterium]